MRLWTTGYSRCLLLVVGCYCALYGALLVCTDGLPYVCDNNESFSSLLHARNLYHFCFVESCGLTDESTSSNPAAHPCLHTHQGNFPRVFAFLIYVLGARTVESQIVVTTLTVGLLVIWLIFDFFARKVTPAFAVLVCALLMTDYLMFAQWQVNTYRVWHGFFIFASLRCIDGLGGTRARTWRVLLFFTFVCLFYYELVFATFVTLLSLLYAAYTYRTDWRQAVRGGACGAAGAMLALFLLFAQLSAYMGPANALRDAYYTVRSRQFTDPTKGVGTDIYDFYRDHRLVFFENFQDGMKLWEPSTLLRNNLVGNLTPYLPIFAVVAFSIGLGWLQGVFWSSPRGNRIASKADRCIGTVLPAHLVAGFHFALLASSGARLATVLLQHGLVWKNIGGPVKHPLIVVAGILLGIGFTFSIARVMTGSWRGLNALSPLRVCLASLTLLLLAAVLRHQEELFSRPQQWTFQTIALELAANFRLIWVLGGLTAAALGVILACRPECVVDRNRYATLNQVLPILGCGAAAYGAVYFLASGYVCTGYLFRWLTFHIFFTAAWFAVIVFLVLDILQNGIKKIVNATTGLQGWNRFGAIAANGLVAILLLWAGTHWGRLQYLYMSLLPPDHWDFMRLLREPPYAGKSFVTSTYATPTACMTGEWATFDWWFRDGSIQRGEEGYLPVGGLRTYRWFADATNPIYAKPDYYLWVGDQPGIQMACTKLTHNEYYESDLRRLIGNMVGASEPRTRPILNRQFMACDTTGRGRWAIVKLDWDYPPYLARLGALETGRVHIDLRNAGEEQVVDVRYSYAHQEGNQEGRTIIRLYLVEDDGTKTLLAEKDGDTSFPVCSGVVGNLQASVIPCSQTKRGEEFFSNLIPVGGAPSLEAPELQQQGRNGARVQARCESEGGRWWLHVRYAYHHMHGEPEADSIVRLYLLAEDGQIRVLKEAIGMTTIDVSEEVLNSGAGAFRVGVIPRTAHARGREYLSTDTCTIPGPRNATGDVSTAPVWYTPIGDDEKVLLIVDTDPRQRNYHLDLYTRASDDSLVKVREATNTNILVVKRGEYRSLEVRVSYPDIPGARESVGRIIQAP